jgi:hypothetical protein
MENDEIRFKELQNQKEEEARKYNDRLNELYIQHNEKMKELTAEHREELEQQIKETNDLKNEMERMVKEHKEQREQIENDAWNQIDVIKEKNKEELVRITEQGLKSKADLQMTNNRYIEFRKKMDTYNRSIQEKQTLLNGQLQQTANSK